MSRAAPFAFGPAIARRVPGALVAAIAALAPVAYADVYKCKGDGAAPVYQESPCPPGKQLRNFQTDPPEITVLPGRPKSGSAAPAPKTAAAPEKAASAQEKAAKADAATKGKFDPAQRANAHVGMSEGDVLAKLGPPDVTSNSPSRRQQRWTWLPADGDPEMVTTMTITDGIVTDLERRTVKK